MAQDIEYEWDEAKRRANLERHGVDFALVEAFDWSAAETVDQSVRGERRHLSFGRIAGRVHALVWTRRGEIIRVISLRKANRRERHAFEEIHGAD
ncbi:MAG: BrnT family toxin [Oceanicaulis sp.]